MYADVCAGSIQLYIALFTYIENLFKDLSQCESVLLSSQTNVTCSLQRHPSGVYQSKIHVYVTMYGEYKRDTPTIIQVN